MKKDTSRRSFLRKAALGSAAFTAGPLIINASPYEQKLLLPNRHKNFSFSANDHIQLALIGSGIQGIHDTMKKFKLPELMFKAFEVLPEMKITPNAAWQQELRGNTEEVKLDELVNRVNA